MDGGMEIGPPPNPVTVWTKFAKNCTNANIIVLTICDICSFYFAISLLNPSIKAFMFLAAITIKRPITRITRTLYIARLLSTPS